MDEIQEAQKANRPSKWQEVLVAVIGSAILLAAMAGGVWFFIHTKNSQPASKKDAYGYTLTPPEGWAKVDPTPDGASVVFAHPIADSDTTGSVKPFIVVQSASLNAQAKQTAFEAISKAYVSQLAQSMADFQLISTSARTLAGAPATLVTFSSSSGDKKTAITTESLFTVKNGISYTANAESLTSAWSKYADQVERSLLTFRP
jgi:hypothetical protein